MILFGFFPLFLFVSHSLTLIHSCLLVGKGEQGSLVEKKKKRYKDKGEGGVRGRRKRERLLNERERDSEGVYLL